MKLGDFSPREGERSWRDLTAEQGALHLAKTLGGSLGCAITGREEERVVMAVVVAPLAFYLGPDELLS